MLWSLIKIVLFVAIVAAITFGAGLLLENGEGVTVAFGGMEYTLGPLQAVIAAVILLVVVWVVLRLVGLLIALLKFANGDDTAFTRYFSRRNERKGHEALADGLLALASGEGKAAMTQAAKAERYLKRPELTSLLTAQAAELIGDRSKATETYKALLKDDSTRFVGVRGLLKQKLSDGDTDTALKLAEKAFAIKPAHGETSDMLLKLQAEHGDWSGARKTLKSKLKHGTLPRDVHRRRDAVLALSEAHVVISDTATIEAKEAAIEANKLSPDLIPAAVMAARGYIADNKARNATRILKRAWDAQPHPDLAAAFAEIAPSETSDARIKRFEALTKAKPDHPETKMLLAELNIAAEDFPAARKALGDLVEQEPTARVLTIMAAVERGEGASDDLVRGWLTKALTARRGPQWVCDNCQHLHSTWGPVCVSCGSFDTLSWREPVSESVAMPKSTEMLPLLVGALADKSAAPEPEAEDVTAQVKDVTPDDLPNSEEPPSARP